MVESSGDGYTGVHSKLLQYFSAMLVSYCYAEKSEAA